MVSQLPPSLSVAVRRYADGITHFGNLILNENLLQRRSLRRD